MFIDMEWNLYCRLGSFNCAGKILKNDQFVIGHFQNETTTKTIPFQHFLLALNRLILIIKAFVHII